MLMSRWSDDVSDVRIDSQICSFAKYVLSSTNLQLTAPYLTSRTSLTAPYLTDIASRVFDISSSLEALALAIALQPWPELLLLSQDIAPPSAYFVAVGAISCSEQ